MAINNSIRNVLMGMGTAGTRGGTGERTIPPHTNSTLDIPITLKAPVNCGKWHVKAVRPPQTYTYIAALYIFGTDAMGAHTTLFFADWVRTGIYGFGWHGPSNNIPGTGANDVELSGDFQSDRDLMKITAVVYTYNWFSSGPDNDGHADFEVWGQPNAG